MADKKNHKMLIIVPPKGARIHSIKLRAFFLVILILLIAGGFTGYFIPVRNFQFDVVESNRKKNMERQNRTLLKRIQELLYLTHNLDNKLKNIKQKKEKISNVLLPDQKGTSEQSENGPHEHAIFTADFNTIKDIKLFFTSMVEKVQEDENYFKNMPILKPVSGKAAVTARFGRIEDPFTKLKKMHEGIDYSAKPGTPVVAAGAGSVISVREDGIKGKVVRIKHSDKFTTVYTHLGDVLTAAGRHVEQGDTIGTIGISGLSTGPHVHFEIRYGGRPVDPYKYLLPDFDLKNGDSIEQEIAALEQ